MKRQTILLGCAVLVLGIGTATAGPCDTSGGTSAKMQQDAGAGPTPGNSGQATATGHPSSGQHPPTGAVSGATSGGAASSQDAQRQMQREPTAAQQAQGGQTTGKAADKGC
jgi:hypothetical protein